MNNSLYANAIDEDKNNKYVFPLDEIPRLSYKDPKAYECIIQEVPVILTDSNLCKSALKWDLPYLQKNLGEGKCIVYASPNHVFKYFDGCKVAQYTPNFTPPTERIESTFMDFMKNICDWKPGGKRVYLQQTLNNTVGPCIVEDFLNFNWEWLSIQQKKNSWGPLTSNLLLIALEGNVTPVHYDEQQNFFCQLRGYKRCLLFHPKYYENLYPYPVFHPHDRQSQVDFENPDFKKFPKLNKLQGYEGVVGPGDVLYIPIYWWHHIESLYTAPDPASDTFPLAFDPDSLEDCTASLKYTVSVNFWYKGRSSEKIEYPLVPRQKLAMIRNVEKMLLEALKDPREVGPLLQALILGRYSPEVQEEFKHIF